MGGESDGCTSAGATGGFTRDGTGGGGVLETLGRLTSEVAKEKREEEVDSVEVVLMVREGAGDEGREETLEGTSGSAERDRAPVTGELNRGDLTKNRAGSRKHRQKHTASQFGADSWRIYKSDLDDACFSASQGEEE